MTKRKVGPLLRNPIPDLTGSRHGILTVLRRCETPPRAKESYWDCACDCGRTLPVSSSQLKREVRKSCGCKWMEHFASANLRHGMARKGRRTPEYFIWAGMKQRCYDPRCQAFRHYGARGISVCERWLNDFAAFYADMGPRPSPELSIDRINNDGDYEPGNCRWATRSEQMRNKRTGSRGPRGPLIEHDGQRRGLAAWSRAMGWPNYVIGNRLRRGWSVEHALTRPRWRDLGRRGPGNE